MKLRIKKWLADCVSFVMGLSLFALMFLFTWDFISRNLQGEWPYLLLELVLVMLLGILGLSYMERALDPEMSAGLVLKKGQLVVVGEERRRSKGVAIEVRSVESGELNTVRFWRAQNTKAGGQYVFIGRKLRPVTVG